MMLPYRSPMLTSLPNGWWQVRFTLSVPLTLEIGARLHIGEHLLAPWRINEQQVDCLALPSQTAPDISLPITLAQQGKPLPHIGSHQRLLISGEGISIADVLLTAQHLKHHASHSLVLLAADTFPCVIKPARFLVAELPDSIAACPLLEDWGFANRLTSHENLPGCYHGSLSELIKAYVKSQTETFYNLKF